VKTPKGRCAMNATRFDDRLRALCDAPSRRGMVRAVGGLLLGLTSIPVLNREWAGARKRKKKKKKCKSCGPCRTCRKGKCIAGPDGTACGSSLVCTAGACVPACPDGEVNCDGSGCLVGECCINADCGTGQICDNRQCAAGAGTCTAQSFLYCQNESSRCNSDNTCACFISPEGRRCGSLNAAQTLCIGCTTNAECASLGPGAFCTLESSPNCLCALGGVCRAACPTV
jgi:hypothetical protein